MALLKMYGFDKHGTFANEWAGDFVSSGGGSYVTAITGRTGTGKAVQHVHSTGGGFTWSELFKTPDLTISGTTLIIAFGLKTAVYNASAYYGDSFCIVRNAAGNEVFSLRFLADGKITFRNNTTVLLTSSQACSPNTWLHFAVKVVLADGTGGSVYFQKDGGDWGSVTGVDTVYNAAGSAVSVQFQGMNQDTLCVDDLVICDGSGSYHNDFLGDRQVIGLPVTSDATPNEWTCSTGSSHFALVDEIGPSATDYLSTAAAGDQELFGFTDLAAAFAGSTDIAVQISAQALKSDAGSRTIKLISKPSGGSISNPSAQTLGTSAQYISQIVAINPLTGVPFTQTEVDALLVGIESA